MHTVDLLDATAHLPDLIERALRGEAVIIIRDGQPLVIRVASPAVAKPVRYSCWIFGFRKPLTKRANATI